ADALERLGDPQAAAPLMPLLDTDARVSAMAALAGALRGSGNDRARERLVALLAEGQVAGAAGDALRILADGRAAGALAGLLWASDAELRLRIVETLGDLPSPEARAAAERSLRDESPHVRAAAAWAVGKLGATTAVPKLRALLADPQPEIAANAA